MKMTAKKYLGLVYGIAADIQRYRAIGDTVLAEQAMRQLESIAGEWEHGRFRLNDVARAALNKATDPIASRAARPK